MSGPDTSLSDAMAKAHDEIEKPGIYIRNRDADERPTPYLRRLTIGCPMDLTYPDGKKTVLQQQWEIVEYDGLTPRVGRTEWRDVPEVEE